MGFYKELISAIVIHSTHNLISDWSKAYSDFSKRLGRHLAADYILIKSCMTAEHNL